MNPTYYVLARVGERERERDLGITGGLHLYTVVAARAGQLFFPILRSRSRSAAPRSGKALLFIKDAPGLVIKGQFRLLCAPLLGRVICKGEREQSGEDSFCAR